MSFRLIVMRHAKSDWDVGAPDFDRPLNGRGRANAAVASEYLREIEVDLALVSPAARTQETWQRLELDVPMRSDPSLYHASSATIAGSIAAAVGQDFSGKTLLVLAHNPGCGELVERLVDSVPAQFDRYEVDRFPTAAIAVIEFANGWPGSTADPGTDPGGTPTADPGAGPSAGQLIDFYLPR